MIAISIGANCFVSGEQLMYIQFDATRKPGHLQYSGAVCLQVTG